MRSISSRIIFVLKLFFIFEFSLKKIIHKLKTGKKPTSKKKKNAFVMRSFFFFLIQKIKKKKKKKKPVSFNAPDFKKKKKRKEIQLIKDGSSKGL